ncbi:hypothetical protein WJX73_001018 [Symbiochloris irregularis]|uniref:Uncharacterized protein n=1 Tax=Symbiochloris irregularis TaxID=706552 RepID=A0AAW1NXX5_9CHLO
MDSDEDDGHSFWSRPFTFGSVSLRVEELWGEGIGGTVWEGGVLAARYLSSPAFAALGIGKGRCIELGAGVSALPSLVAAHLGCFTEVVATDIRECYEGLQANVAANLPACAHLESCSRPEGKPPEHIGWDEVKPSVVQALISDQNHARDRAHSDAESLSTAAFEQQGTAAPNQYRSHESGKINQVQNGRKYGTMIKVQVLDWRDDVAFLGPPFDVILVADVVYVAELAEPLLLCMWRLSNASSVILLAYYERSKSAHARFWELLPSYFNAVKIPESSYGQNEQAASIGLFRLHRIEYIPA